MEYNKLMLLLNKCLGRKLSFLKELRAERMFNSCHFDRTVAISLQDSKTCRALAAIRKKFRIITYLNHYFKLNVYISICWLLAECICHTSESHRLGGSRNLINTLRPLGCLSH